MRNAPREILIFVVGLAVGALLAVVVPVVIRAIGDLAPESDDPLGYVTVISDVDPLIPDLPDVVARLDSSTGAKWRAPLLIRSSSVSATTTLTADRIAELDKVVVIPDPDTYSLSGVATNVESEASVRAQGAFYMVAISRLAPAKKWLREDKRIFADDAQEKVRVTFRAGSLIFYYAPTGETDQTEAIRRYVNEVVRCPRDAGPCPG